MTAYLFATSIGKLHPRTHERPQRDATFVGAAAAVPVRALGPGRPFYGLQSLQTAVEGETAPESIEEMADLFAPSEARRKRR